jgi:hypothetical protein
MYRDIDKELVARNADDARIVCPACGLPNRTAARRCSCGYDLTREDEDPADRFRGELRRSAKTLLLIGAACLSPLLLVVWNAVAPEDYVLGEWQPNPIGPVAVGIAFIMAGLRRWKASR